MTKKVAKYLTGTRIVMHVNKWTGEEVTSKYGSRYDSATIRGIVRGYYRKIRGFWDVLIAMGNMGR